MSRPDTKAAVEALRRSIALAESTEPHTGASGRPGPFICATVELRVEDMRTVLDRVEAMEKALGSIAALVTDPRPGAAFIPLCEAVSIARNALEGTPK